MLRRADVHVPITDPTQPTVAAAHPAVLSLVIPTYNEHTRLGELVEAVFAVFRSHDLDGELVIVDDNSPDGTGALADRLAKQYRIRVVHRPGKLGLGTAVIDGFAAATGDVLGVMDADLSHPAEALPRLLRALDDLQADMAIGSRYIEGGGVRNWPWFRRAMSRFACRLAGPLTPARDATSGFFLVRRAAVRDVQIAAGGFKICLELLVRGRVRRVVEVPYTFSDRAAGESKMSWKEATGYFWQIRDLLLYRQSHPADQSYFRALP